MVIYQLLYKFKPVKGYLNNSEQLVPELISFLDVKFVHFLMGL
jgi:hypothetical protein